MCPASQTTKQSPHCFPGFAGKSDAVQLNFREIFRTLDIMRTKLLLDLDLPEGVKLSEYDAAMIIAGKLWQEGYTSYGKAARMVGIDKKEFIESLGKYGYPFTNISSYELYQELDNVSHYNI
jgi:predicted HTH domain antitoxin